MKYASLILTYNRKDKLFGALQAVLSQSKKPVKIFLVDNCSTDGTQEMLKQHGFLDNPLIDYLRLSKNYGGSGGYYYGIKMALESSARFDYLALSDDDAYYNYDFFSLISRAEKQHPECKAFCGTVTFQDGTIQTDHRRKITNRKWFRQEYISPKDYQHDFYVDEFSFVGCVIKRDLLKQIGLPHKDYFINYDDTEYSLRVGEHTKILNVSKAVIVHQIKRSSDPNSVVISWKNYYEIRNSMLMKKAHSNWALLPLYFRYHYLHLVLKIIFQSKFKGQRRAALYVYGNGFKDGLRGISGEKAPFLPGQQLPY